jgi:hypothetical protein
MTDDPNRKTLRQFQCRDYLWDTFEQMSQELECSVDYLINESMRHYARSQGKLRQTMAPNANARSPVQAQPSGAPMMASQRPMPSMPQSSMAGGRPPGPPPMAQRQMQATPMVAYGGAQRPPPQQPALAYAQPRPAAPQPPAFPGANGMPMLYAVYEGQKYPIMKDEFYIGRSNKSCDLIVKDPNVSRQHARIVRHQGQFWMVDMGSTNGIDYNGTRVDRRPIAEGDVFRVCDHEIAFTYR